MQVSKVQSSYPQQNFGMALKIRQGHYNDVTEALRRCNTANNR